MPRLPRPRSAKHEAVRSALLKLQAENALVPGAQTSVARQVGGVTRERVRQILGELVREGLITNTSFKKPRSVTFVRLGSREAKIRKALFERNKEQPLRHGELSQIARRMELKPVDVVSVYDTMVAEKILFPLEKKWERIATALKGCTEKDGKLKEGVIKEIATRFGESPQEVSKVHMRLVHQGELAPPSRHATALDSEAAKIRKALFSREKEVGPYRYGDMARIAHNLSVKEQTVYNTMRQMAKEGTLKQQITTRHTPLDSDTVRVRQTIFERIKHRQSINYGAIATELGVPSDFVYHTYKQMRREGII